MQGVFAAVLDVMKQEARGETPAGRARVRGPPKAAVGSLAVVGTGLLGASVALAAKRAGVARVTGWDADPETLREAVGREGDRRLGGVARRCRGRRGARRRRRAGRRRSSRRRVKSSPRVAADATVTDVGSTKRALAQSLDDPRLVPGHPLAGGATGGPARAAADLFDGATWFLTPVASTDAARVDLVERFVATLGARAIRLDAETHDRLLALTSHLPHALANLLMQSVAQARRRGARVRRAHRFAR